MSIGRRSISMSGKFASIRSLAIQLVPFLVLAVTVGEFVITKYVDKSSPILFG
jgi:type VI protein secretion system component Hcp